MVLDTIDNAEKYEMLHKDFKKAFDFIRNSDLESMEPGRYEIDNETVFALLQGYTTQDISEKQFEAHRNYIDIQYIISGSEMMGYTTPASLTVASKYDPHQDIEMYRYSAFTKCEMDARSFCIFYPEEPHMPGCHIPGNRPGEVKKLVVKIKKQVAEK